MILVLVDTQRADHLSSYGYERNTSPRLDAFASANVRFERVRSQAACTSPSVSSLFTSRSPLVLMDQPKGHLGIPPALPSLAEILKQHGYWTVAVSSSPIVRKSPSEANRFGEFDRGFDVFDEECLMEDARCVNRRALGLIDTITPPFFVYLHYMDVHAPYAPPDDFERPFSQPYLGHDLVRAGRPQQFQQVARKRGLEIGSDEVRHFVDRYDDEVAFFDSELGHLIDALSQRDLLDESIVVIASDHGDAFMEQGYLGHCRVPLFEGMVRTPLVMAIPGVERRKPVGVDVQNLDIVPTIVDYLGHDASEYAFEGRSLRDTIEGRDSTPQLTFAVQGVELAVSDRDYTLTYDVDTRRTGIFERTRDPEHRRNLASQPPPTSRALREEIDRQLALVSDASDDDAVAERARRLEGELRALGYLLEPDDEPADERAPAP